MKSNHTCPHGFETPLDRILEDCCSRGDQNGEAFYAHIFALDCVLAISAMPVIAQGIFQIFALNSTLDLPAGAMRADVEKAMEGKILARGAYVGRAKPQ